MIDCVHLYFDVTCLLGEHERNEMAQVHRFGGRSAARVQKERLVAFVQAQNRMHVPEKIHTFILNNLQIVLLKLSSCNIVITTISFFNLLQHILDSI